MSDTPVVIPDDLISVSVEAASWLSTLPRTEVWIADLARLTLQAACPGIGPAGIGILLTDDAAIRELNRTWRGKDSPTNVLSFPATETAEGALPKPEFEGVPLELGDIALAYETCERESRTQGKRFADHVAHLVLHGVLHLLGYDHLADDEAQRMEALEIRILAGLGIADPYETELAGAIDD
ncbi:MAG: ybeY [Rhodospirillales bacterium]|nr:ybeY [Rhodospirillales bacterium]